MVAASIASEKVAATLAPRAMPLPVGVAALTLGAVVSRTVASCTVTWKESLAMLPAASVAEQLTGGVPIGNVSPEVASQLTCGLAGFSSVAVGACQLT